jgi:hypothetical protein
LVSCVLAPPKRGDRAEDGLRSARFAYQLEEIPPPRSYAEQFAALETFRPAWVLDMPTLCR